MKRLAIFTALCLFSIITMGIAPLTIDNFQYTDSEAARAIWKNIDGGPVQIEETGVWGNEKVMVMPIEYTETTTRNYWDGYKNLDLTLYDIFDLEIYIEDPSLISNFTLYFHNSTTETWNAASTSALENGWQTLQFNKTNFNLEGDDFAWQHIDRIRLSPWQSKTGNAIMAVRKLSARKPAIALVKGTLNTDQRSAGIYCDIIESILKEWNLDYSLIHDEDVETGALTGSELAIFPFNSNMTTNELTQIQQFSSSGGKIILFFTISDTISQILHIDSQGYYRPTDSGELSYYCFEDNAPNYLPEKIAQKSWNIYKAYPADSTAKTIAYWYTSNDTKQNYPAWILSEQGAYFSHVMVETDMNNQSQMLLALCGHFRPECWEEASTGCIDNIGSIGPYTTYASCVNGINSLSMDTAQRTKVNTFLTKAEQYKNTAQTALNENREADAISNCFDAQLYLQEAYAYAQSPQNNEFRACWEHSGTSPWPGNWEKGIEILTANGLNTIVPNMLRGGTAHYNSEYLVKSEEFQQYGDQITACVNAAHAKGVKVHVWKVNWNCSQSSEEWLTSMRSANRLQVSVEGEAKDWLCPSNPLNLQLEINTLLEIVRNYNVDGIHFDYIRYPDSKHCFCDSCRQRFETWSGQTVTNWPSDCYDGDLSEQYQEFRANQITELVKQVSIQARQIKPEIEISAAVFRDYASCRKSVGQDWVLWANEGYLDFLCPMDYIDDYGTFCNVVETQQNLIQNRIPLYPGIGAYIHTADQTIAQIVHTRERNTNGFILFNYNASLADSIFPELRKGTTKPVQSDCKDFMIYR